MLAAPKLNEKLGVPVLDVSVLVELFAGPVTPKLNKGLEALSGFADKDDFEDSGLPKDNAGFVASGALFAVEPKTPELAPPNIFGVPD